MGLPPGQVNKSTYEPVDLRDDEGRPPRAIRNASEAVLCTGFVAKHPAFTGIPMDELLDRRHWPINYSLPGFYEGSSTTFPSS